MTAKSQNKAVLAVFTSQPAFVKEWEIEEKLINLDEAVYNWMGKSACRESSGCAWTQCNMRCFIQHQHASSGNIPRNAFSQNANAAGHHLGEKKQRRACA